MGLVPSTIENISEGYSKTRKEILKNKHGFGEELWTKPMVPHWVSDESPISSNRQALDSCRFGSETQDNTINHLEISCKLV